MDSKRFQSLRWGLAHLHPTVSTAQPRLPAHGACGVSARQLFHMDKRSEQHRRKPPDTVQLSYHRAGTGTRWTINHLLLPMDPQHPPFLDFPAGPMFPVRCQIIHPGNPRTLN